jgi:tetratricopeptide (TPR) repeat protein
MELGTASRRKTTRKGFFRLLHTAYQRSVLRPYYYLAGLINLRRGRLPRAESCLCRAALIDPKNFNTRVQLGRVYFLMEEFFKAEQQFLKAQEIDPKRFHRNHLPEDYTCWEEIEAGEDRSDSIFGDYDTEGSLYSFDEGEYSGVNDIDSPGYQGEDFRYGDFSSYQEWKRIQSLPPITRTEIRNTDWDQIFSE